MAPYACPSYLDIQLQHVDVLARLSVYTVPSSAPSYTALVSHFLPPQSALPHTAVMIVLDWTRPWSFLEEIYTWLTWIEHWVKGDGTRELQVIREEHRERCMSISPLSSRSEPTARSHRAGPPPVLRGTIRRAPPRNFHCSTSHHPSSRSGNVYTQCGRSTHRRRVHQSGLD